MRALKNAIAKLLHWTPLASFRWFRSAVFDSAKPGTLLLSPVGSERYIVSSSDRVVGRGVYIRGEYDFAKLEQVLELLGKNFGRGLIVDVGANIGTICIPAVKRGHFARAIAVEPEPFNFSLLASNVNINGLSGKIDARNLALGANSGEELAFELSETNFGDHRIRVAGSDGTYGEAGRRTIKVKSDSFDHAIGDVDPAGTLVWIDTQGFEGFVLAGAVRALKSRPPLLMEFWPYGLERAKSYGPLKQAILAAGYTRLHDLSHPGTETKISAESLDQLFSKYQTGGRATDVLFR